MFCMSEYNTMDLDLQHNVHWLQELELFCPLRALLSKVLNYCKTPD